MTDEQKTSTDGGDGKFNYYPPYTPYQTVQGFIDSLDPRALPRQIDKSMMRTLSGGAQRKLWAGLIFLGFIKPDGLVTDLLKQIVGAKDNPDNRKALMANVITKAYEPVIKDFDATTGTAKQLEDAFRGVPGLESSTLKESIRFYIHARKACGLELSPYISARQPRAPRKPVVNAKTNGDKKPDGKPDLAPGQKPPADETPSGMVDFPIPIGNTNSFIRVPKSITISQFPMVKAITDVIEAMAKLNSPVDQKGTTTG